MIFSSSIRKIYYGYIDALAGRGKTEYFVRTSVTLAGDGEKVLILLPRVALCQEVLERIRIEIAKRNFAAPINLKTIHHENCAGSVVGAIISHIKNEEYPEGEILILTMAAYDLINWNSFRLWAGARYLFIDEIPAADAFYDRNLPDYHGLISTHMQTIPSGVPGYSSILCPDIEKVKEMARNRGKDEVGDILQPLAHVLSSKYWANWVEDEHHEKLLAGKNSRLQVHSLRDPASFACGWKKVVVGGALFRNSMLYQIWSGFENVEFIEELQLPGPNHHENGELITFHWAISGRMTKHKRNKLRGNDGATGFANTFVQQSAQSLSSMGVSNNEVMFLSNKDDKTDFKDATQLPYSPSGTNDYRDKKYFVCTGAFNQNPAHEKFLIAASPRLDVNKIWRATHFSAIYQGGMRGVPRNPDNTEQVHYFIPDQQTAWELMPYFPGCRSEGMGMENWRLPEAKQGGRPKKYADDEERKQYDAERKREEWKQHDVERTQKRKQEKLERILKEWRILNGLENAQ